MDDANLGRAIAVLKRQTEIGIPMTALHAAMHRMGAAHLTLVALDSGLRDRSDVFAVIDPPALPWDTTLWPRDAMSRYRKVLCAVGYTADTFVVLRPDPAQPADLVSRMRAAVIALQHSAPAGPAAARALLAANATNASWNRVRLQRDGTVRPTIRLRDRRPPGPGLRRAPRRRRRRPPPA